MYFFGEVKLWSILIRKSEWKFHHISAFKQLYANMYNVFVKRLFSEILLNVYQFYTYHVTKLDGSLILQHFEDDL